MRVREQSRLMENRSKILFDLIVEYVWHRAQPFNNSRKKEVFKDYNNRWINYCYQQRTTKVKSNPKAFSNIVNDIKKLRSLQKDLGLPIEKLTFWQKIFGI